ncbi:unnamed protein product [marine sediment metagenome]|uniref:Uncharacterized protein n=1 Tax=marine sediment metagenome TaxID=412755 RepID=X0YP89_9ZZZZ
MSNTIDQLDRDQARELLKAFLIVSTYLDEQMDIIRDTLHTCQVIEALDLIGLPDMEATV